MRKPCLIPRQIAYRGANAFRKALEVNIRISWKLDHCHFPIMFQSLSTHDRANEHFSKFATNAISAMSFLGECEWANPQRINVGRENRVC